MAFKESSMDTITLRVSTRELSHTIAKETELYKQFPDASDLKFYIYIRNQQDHIKDNLGIDYWGQMLNAKHCLTVTLCD